MRAILPGIVGALTLGLVPALVPDAARAAERPLPGAQVMRELARDRGCMTCHREKAPAAKEDSTVPTAPSWQQVAARYRNVPDARKRLVDLVLTGSDPNDRHWKNNVAFDRMLPNEIATTPEEADLLVRWILSFR